MTDIEQKALALVNEACKSDFKDLGSTYRNNLLDALLHAIEQHEAFRQEVSDAVKAYPASANLGKFNDIFSRFIIAKPDPLVEILRAACTGMEGTYSYEELADAVSAIGKACGYEFTKIGEKAGE